ncbi:hypothetical protein TELCIR_18318 [Teladorsagia circumcincta]|uniref:ET module n=1 Tax=Teladorsagia circumcincta TaxID=45464 RepID=A0A2G9TQD3_TELCI|nr:hypothetical protein TELCIR_18318 [Teladorsagia circumcincta]
MPAQLSILRTQVNNLLISACEAYSLCPNGGVKLFIGCTTNIQCQLHNPDTVCIDSCCCTLPRVLETSTYGFLYDSGVSQATIVISLALSLLIFLYL